MILVVLVLVLLCHRISSVTCQVSKDSASEIIHNPTKSNVILFSDLCAGHRPQQPATPAIRQARSRRTKNTSSVSPLIVTSSGLRHLLFTVAPLYSSPAPTGSHRRRRSSATNNIPPALNLEESSPVKRYSGANYGLNDRDTGEPLPTIPGTPGEMSLSRSPSPRLGGGWSTPGLNTPHGSMSGQSSPRKGYGNLNGGTSTVTWASAKAKSDEINGYPAFSTRSNGFFSRHYRSISNTLPRFNMGGRRDYAEKEKLGRGRWYPDNGSKLGRLRTCTGTIFRRMRLRLLILLAFVLAVVLFYVTPASRAYRRASFLGGGSKFVIILAANQGGGVMEWKGAREWAIERDSIKNKQKYARRWGYQLEIADVGTKKRYAHEWRESWEKVDIIRNTMRKYPDAEWFWWLDLNTFIMEPSKSLQSHIFNDLSSTTYRDINKYNPLKIQHPFTEPYLDKDALSPVGDGKADSINLIVPQDCSGFNLGSFFIRRNSWTDRLMDIWWDPVSYEQKHMQWEHKEQDALEHLYSSHPWIRSHTAFIQQRKINSFPPGACDEHGNDAKIHYKEEDRDFLVNMAGCEWGRDCWGEMYNYRELSNKLNRTLWEKFKDRISDTVKSMRKPKEKKD